MRRLLRVAGRWAASPRWIVLAGVVGILALLAFLLLVIVYLPQLAIDSRGLSRTDWLKAVQDLRTSILQSMGGLAVLVGAVVAALNLRETSRQNRAVLELQRRGQTTERFTRSIEQLGQRGDDKLDVRIGAIYALEQIARDASELHWPTVEVLTAFLRGHAPRPPNVDSQSGPPPADIQAIISVVGRRDSARDQPGRRLYMHRVDLGGADLRGADLRGAVLAEANLHEAVFSDADLRDCDLRNADLSGARLSRARLDSANLIGANLAGARGRGTSLQAALVRDANLDGALFGYANLQRADLRGANLEGVWLRGSNLGSAQLAGARLRGATLIAVDLHGTDLAQVDLADVTGLTPEQLADTRNPSP